MNSRAGRSHNNGLRTRLAQEAARLMIEHGIVDFGLAKRKAAERFGVTTSGALPSNAQIEDCLSERQRIYEPGAHEQRVRELRRHAVAIMQPLAAFEPRLAGAVLTGTATINSVIEVHLFSESIEAVADVLALNGYAASCFERRFRFGGGRSDLRPGFRLNYRDEEAILPVFPANGIREAPLSAVDQRPMERASLSAVERLLTG